MTARHRYYADVQGHRVTSRKRPLALLRQVVSETPEAELATIDVYKIHKHTGAVSRVATLAEIKDQWGE